MKNPTAKQAHTSKKIEATKLLQQVQICIGASGKGEDVNWGHVGDMAHIVDQLKNLLEGFGK